MSMSVGCLRKALVLQVRFTLAASPTPQILHFLLHHICPFSSSSKAHSFTVSYLINSCGFSQKAALSAAKYLRLKTPEKPNSVFSFVDSHGFSKSQITQIVKTQPQLLRSDPDKTLLPKLQFFYCKGASKPDVAKIVAACPSIMKPSLENQIIPSFNFVKDFLQSEEKAMFSVKRCSEVLICNLHTCVQSNISALQEFGVPKSNIATLLRHHPRALVGRPNHFREILEQVKKMGFDPSKTAFAIAVKAMTGMSKSTWERKIDVYKRWGWSEEEIQLAFTKSPRCMIYSENKITAAMDFYVNKMGKESSLIVRWPTFISLSLEKRIIPRYSVVQVLLSKGLIKKDISTVALFGSTENMFLRKFVHVYKDEAPQLMELYQEKINISKKQETPREGSGNCRLSTL